MTDALYDGTGLPPEDTEELEQAPGPDMTLDVPDGTLEEHLDWVRAGEGNDGRRERADAVWAHANPDQLSDEERAQLSAALTGAAYSPEPTPNPEDQAPQSDGDGPPYEGGANLSGPDAGTGTDTPDAVAVAGDDRTPDEVEADQNAAGNSGDIASGAYVEGVTVQSDTAGTGEAVNAETGEVTAPGQPLPPVEDTGTGTPLDAPAPFDPEQSEQQPT